MAFKQRHLKGILQVELGVGEQSYLIVHEIHANAMKRAQGTEWHVSRNISRPWIMLITCHVHRISGDDIQVCLPAGGRWVEGCFHVVIVAERRVILSLCD